MAEDTQPPPDGELMDTLCPTELRQHFAYAVELGSAVVVMAAWWADAAAGLISEFEGRARELNVPDAAVRAVAAAVGIDGLYDTASQLIELAEVLSLAR